MVLPSTTKEVGMKVTGFNHFAIKTVDYRASLVFYRDVLGFTQLATVDTEEASSTNLMIPGGSIVELVDAYEKGRNPGVSGDAVVDHIAFDVDDVEASEAALRKCGVDILQSCTDLVAFNTRVVKCKDPNGIIVSFRKDIS
jgi:catechol 2,3-dioxygenase-like lactoylglutathione lyase family enzyme